jgi:hypothetical protein
MSKASTRSRFWLISLVSFFWGGCFAFYNQKELAGLYFVMSGVSAGAALHSGRKK